MDTSFKQLCQLCSLNTRHDDINTDEIDWQAVWKLALRHRVVPVMADGLKQLDISVPSDIAELIAKNIQKNLMKGLNQAAELVSLTRLFEKNSIPFITFKGIALSKQMGLELHQRHNGDIDLLLANIDDLWKADALLQKEGYARLSPPQDLLMNHKQMSFFLKNRKDITYWHPNKKINLELHFRLFHNTHTLQTLPMEFFRNRSVIQISSSKIPVMNKDDHKLYLLLHGAWSCWFRLKWLCDIPLISDNGKYYCSKSFLSESKLLGVDRMVFYSLILANNILAMPIPKSLSTLKKPKKSISRLLHYAKFSLYQEKPELSITSFFEKVVQSEILLRTQLSYKYRVVVAHTTTPYDWRLYPLPPSLFFIYIPLRPFLWLRRYFSSSVS